MLICAFYLSLIGCTKTPCPEATTTVAPEPSTTEKPGEDNFCF